MLSMSSRASSRRRSLRDPSRSKIRGFTIVEVAMAAFVLALGITTSITTMQYGMRMVDTARNMTLAGQIMQSEMEILRLQNWAQIVALSASTVVDPSTTITSGMGTSLDATLTTIASRFTCTRTVADISGKADMKKITLRVAWNGVDGRAHSLVFETRYAKNGLSDYFYVAH
jgi:Tfp pilus assembly protein PilV